MSCRQPFLLFQLRYVWLFPGFPPAHYHPRSFPKLRTDGIRGCLPMSSEWFWSRSAPSSDQTNQIKKSRSIFNFANPHKHQTLHTDINTIFDSPRYSRCGSKYRCWRVPQRWNSSIWHQLYGSIKVLLAGLEGFYLVTNIKHLLGDLTLNVIRLSFEEIEKLWWLNTYIHWRLLEEYALFFCTIYCIYALYHIQTF